MSYSLKQAAEATGRTKPTILRAIQLGKVSAKKDEHGQWKIEPAELHRVYNPAPESQPASAPTPDMAAQREIDLLRAMLADKDKQIDSLSRRVESADDERRTTLRQLAALLTDQRPPIAAPAPQPPPAATQRGFWQRLTGRAA